MPFTSGISSARFDRRPAAVAEFPHPAGALSLDGCYILLRQIVMISPRKRDFSVWNLSESSYTNAGQAKVEFSEHEPSNSCAPLDVKILCLPGAERSSLRAFAFWSLRSDSLGNESMPMKSGRRKSDWPSRDPLTCQFPHEMSAPWEQVARINRVRGRNEPIDPQWTLTLWEQMNPSGRSGGDLCHPFQNLWRRQQ